MADSLTYTSLVTDVESYLIRTDPAIIAQIPRFVMLAESTIATELKILGFQQPVTGQLLANSPTLQKPAYWHDTVSFNYTDVAGNRVEILPRAYEYCRNFWPNPIKTDNPRFYADYDFNNFLIVPTPSSPFNFELVYHARLLPLDTSNSTNWITINAPQLLLAAVLVQAYMWSKNGKELAVWQPQYDRHLASFTGEDRGRSPDRTTKVG